MSSQDTDNFKQSSAFNRTASFFGDDRADTTAERDAKDRKKRDDEAKASAQSAADRAAAGLSPSGAQFATRAQDYEARAGASGVSRTGSDADLLGFVGSRKRAGAAARRILGD